MQIIGRLFYRGDLFNPEGYRFTLQDHFRDCCHLASQQDHWALKLAAFCGDRGCIEGLAAVVKMVKWRGWPRC